MKVTFPTLFSSIHEFLATCQDYPYVMADSLLDVLTKGGHSRTLQESETVRMLLKNRVIYHWFSSVSHQCYETMGLTSVAAELHSTEKTAQPGWSPWVEDNERKQVTRLPGSVRARWLSLSPHLGNVEIKTWGYNPEVSLCLVPEQKKEVWAHRLDTELTKMIGNVLFLM